jgi:hypothetical protein
MMKIYMKYIMKPCRYKVLIGIGRRISILLRSQAVPVYKQQQEDKARRRSQ